MFSIEKVAVTRGFFRFHGESEEAAIRFAFLIRYHHLLHCLFISIL